jgi:hypothetical protein
LDDGLGVFIFQKEVTGGAGIAIGHNGAHDGVHTEAWNYPESGTTIVAIIDSPEDANKIVTATLGVLFGK